MSYLLTFFLCEAIINFYLTWTQYSLTKIYFNFIYSKTDVPQTIGSQILYSSRAVLSLYSLNQVQTNLFIQLRT